MRALAESRLHDLVPRERRWGSTGAQDEVILLSAGRSGVLADLDMNLLRDIKRRVAGSGKTSFAAAGAIDDINVSPVEPAPEIRIMVSVGSTVELGEDIFILKNASAYTGDPTKLRGPLGAAIRWENLA